MGVSHVGSHAGGHHLTKRQEIEVARLGEAVYRELRAEGFYASKKVRNAASELDKFLNSNYLYSAIEGMMDGQTMTLFSQEVFSDLEILYTWIKNAIEEAGSSLIQQWADKVQGDTDQNQISKDTAMLNTIQQKATTNNDAASNLTDAGSDLEKKLSSTADNYNNFFSALYNAVEALVNWLAG